MIRFDGVVRSSRRRGLGRRAPDALVTGLCVALVAVVGSAACSDSTGPTPIDPDTTDTTTTPPDTTLPPPASAALALVVDGLERPLYLTTAPGDGDRLFILEQPGRVRVVRRGSLLPTPYLDLTSVIADGGERGLLGLAFHPDYATNGQVFVHHSDRAGNTRIVRFTGSGDRADAGSAVEVLTLPQPYGNHNGGQLEFGPDGMLYVGLGDGGGQGDPDGNAQNRSTLLGSILRIDVDGAPPYEIPADNPFVGSVSARPEIWLYGVRNPWRFSFDRATGDLYVADVGQSRREEVTVVPASHGGGGNLGWNRIEGSLCYPSGPCDTAGTLLPTYEYDHGDGCSISGGYVYRGSAIPSFQGLYFFADSCGGWIHSLRATTGAAPVVFDHGESFGTVSSITSFGQDGAGELYVIAHGGSVYKIVPDGS